MQIVVANNATMAVSSYVSYMKQQGFNKNNLIKSKNAMLRFVNGFINREISGKTDDEPVWRTCYWRDGYTPMTWYFTFYILPQQNLVLIVSFYSQEGSPNVNENRQVIRLNESQLRGMIEKHLNRILNEYYKPVEHNKEITLNNGAKVKSLVTLEDKGGGVYEIWEDDGCYVCCDMNYYRNNDDYHPMYIFPELLKALKDLPSLPIQ